MLCWNFFGILKLFITDGVFIFLPWIKKATIYGVYTVPDTVLDSPKMQVGFPWNF